MGGEAWLRRRSSQARAQTAASEAVIYVMMAVILLTRPRGLFGEEGMMS